MSTLEAHPAAELFPLLAGAAYESFKADIAERGLLEPIWLYEGKILDGRNRYRACIDTGTEPRFENYTGETPISFAWSLNGERRHLTESQRGAIARRMLPELREEAKKRQREHGGTAPGKHSVSKDTECSAKGRATEKAAQRVGVSNATVNRVEYVATRDPELLKKIESGEISATKAVEIVKAKEGKPAPSKPKSLPAEQRAEQIRELAHEGNRAEQIAGEIGISEQRVRELAKRHNITLPDAAIGKVHRINARRVIESTVQGLEGNAIALKAIKGSKFDGFTTEDARIWADSLGESIKILNWLRKSLQEFANGNQ